MKSNGYDTSDNTQPILSDTSAHDATMYNNESLDVKKVVPTPLVTFHKPDDPETKLYLILIIGFDEEGDEFRDFEFVTGRTAAYEYIRELVETIDLMASRIVVDTESISNTKPVAKFMKHVIDNGLIDDPGFDIMDYIPGDYDFSDWED